MGPLMKAQVGHEEYENMQNANKSAFLLKQSNVMRAGGIRKRPVYTVQECCWLRFYMSSIITGFQMQRKAVLEAHMPAK